MIDVQYHLTVSILEGDDIWKTTDRVVLWIDTTRLEDRSSALQAAERALDRWNDRNGEVTQIQAVRAVFQRGRVWYSVELDHTFLSHQVKQHTPTTGGLRH